MADDGKQITGLHERIFQRMLVKRPDLRPDKNNIFTRTVLKPFQKSHIRVGGLHRRQVRDGIMIREGDYAYTELCIPLHTLGQRYGRTGTIFVAVAVEIASNSCAAQIMIRIF